MNGKIVVNSNFERFINIFLEENSKINLISHNDEQYLYEKHIYDSLGIKLFFDKYKKNFKNLLDIGCGGGFPCIPISIEYPELQVTGIDSIRKKILSVDSMKEKLNLKNLILICNRIENINQDIKYDIVVSRAVADLAKISEYALPHVNKNGYFIAYKSVKTEEEIAKALGIVKKFNSEIIDIIEYTLPTEELHTRKLVCIKKL